MAHPGQGGPRNVRLAMDVAAWRAHADGAPPAVVHGTAMAAMKICLVWFPGGVYAPPKGTKGGEGREGRDNKDAQWRSSEPRPARRGARVGTCPVALCTTAGL